VALDIVSKLGNLYKDQDRLVAAEAMYERTLVGTKSALRPYHMDIIFSNQGRLEEAEYMYQLVPPVRKTLGPDNSSTLVTVHNFSNVYNIQGLVGAFTACISSLEYGLLEWQFRKDFLRSLLKLYTARIQLSHWDECAKLCQSGDESQQHRETLIKSREAIGMVEDTLGGVMALLAEGISNHYKYQVKSTDMISHDTATNVKSDQGHLHIKMRSFPINSCKSHIERDLPSALQHIRRHSNCDRKSWNYAACIDQSDVVEKNSQLGFVRDVDRLRAWLGVYAEDNPRILWLRGKPDCGKSILTSDLRSIYFFFDFELEAAAGSGPIELARAFLFHLLDVYAVCVDRDEMVEKNPQLGITRDTYGRAQASLGESTEDSGRITHKAITTGNAQLEMWSPLSLGGGTFSYPDVQSPEDFLAQGQHISDSTKRKVVYFVIFLMFALYNYYLRILQAAILERQDVFQYGYITTSWGYFGWFLCLCGYSLFHLLQCVDKSILAICDSLAKTRLTSKRAS
jgi:hypothetical protein